MEKSIKDEKDFFEIPDFLLTWRWLKNRFKARKEQFEFAELLYLDGYTLAEIAEIRNYSTAKVARDIKDILEFVKQKMTE